MRGFSRWAAIRAVLAVAVCALSQVVWDPESVYPGSPMPPFGKNRILSQKEIDQVVDFIWSL